MENTNLPLQRANEPEEEAHQPTKPDNENTGLSQTTEHVGPKNVTFSESTQSHASQSSSIYKETLSQPALGLSHRQRMLWLQKRRETGLWVNCDQCGRWRYLPHVLDRHELPEKWFCYMNTDKNLADCSTPEAPLRVRDEEDLIHSEWSAGSVVWARAPGWPWWPAIVDDCPDTEQFYWLDGFSDIPTHYNVVFFDSIDVTRAWVAPQNMLPYSQNKKIFPQLLKDKKYKIRLQAAVNQADDADSLPLATRLIKYSFLARYPGKINSPRKISKRDLVKFQNKLKRKFNIEFEDSSEADDCNLASYETSKVIRKKVSLNKPKKTNAQKISTPKNGRKYKRVVPEYKTKEDGTVNNNEKLNNPDVDKKKEQCEVIMDEEKKTVNETKIDNDVKNIREPSSMVVQHSDTAPTYESFDNDTSKTYVPDDVTQLESQNEIISTVTSSEFNARVASPISDDFDF